MFSGALIVGEGWWGVVWGMVVFAWKFYLGPAKIVFFSSCGFNRSNKYGTFWHFALTGYFCLSLCVFISIQNIGRNIPLKILRDKVRTRELQMIYWYNSVTHRNVKFVLLVNFPVSFFSMVDAILVTKNMNSDAVGISSWQFHPNENQHIFW